jgi:hypothetical protein
MQLRVLDRTNRQFMPIASNALGSCFKKADGKPALSPLPRSRERERQAFALCLKDSLFVFQGGFSEAVLKIESSG